MSAPIPDNFMAERPSPWSLSAGEAVVRMLLERGDVNPNRQDVHGQTTISCALDGRHEGVPMLPRKDAVPVGVSYVGEILFKVRKKPLRNSSTDDCLEVDNRCLFLLLGLPYENPVSKLTPSSHTCLP